MWRTEFQVTGAARKALVKALEQATGEKAKYMGVPSCAYQVGEYTVTKEGTLEYDDSIAETEATDHVYAVLADAGFKTGLEETPAEPEGPTGVLVSIPLTRHTSGTLRNLINLIYTRAGLLNKALETSFRVDGGLVERLAEEKYDTSVDRLIEVITDYEAEHGKALEGILLEDGKVSFSGLPDLSDPAKVHAFATICGMINKQALESRRIVPREINELNEKYSMRIWLTRLGMNGPEYKEDRAILMRNLTGNCAFHTPADQERWTQKQAEKRAALKAAKEAAANEEEAE